MKEKRTVRGLLDVIVADADGIDWEMAKPSATYLPGMGLGATPEAFRWAWLGYCADELRKNKRPRGRPRRNNSFNTDCYRAYRCWAAVDSLRKNRGIGFRISNREAIHIVRLIDEHLSNEEPAFPRSITDASAEQSLSRGRRTLGISADWQSDACDEIAKMVFDK